MNLAQTLLEARTLWVLVDPGQRGRLAVPPSVGSGVIPLERLGPPEDTSGYPLEPLVPLLQEFLQSQDQEWGLVVSVPKGTPETTAVGSLLKMRGGRSLTEEERSSVQEAGMEVPLGPWGDPGQSEMWLLLAGGRPR
jgi:hypothetical protein